MFPDPTITGSLHLPTVLRRCYLCPLYGQIFCNVSSTLHDGCVEPHLAYAFMHATGNRTQGATAIKLKTMALRFVTQHPAMRILHQLSSLKCTHTVWRVLQLVMIINLLCKSASISRDTLPRLARLSDELRGYTIFLQGQHGQQ
jgi:hypothetical protein